jgi:hypothetical protein
VKVCGVTVAMLPGQELGTSLVERSCCERGNRPRSPFQPGIQSGWGAGPSPADGRERGGGSVVVRARERRVHGEESQQVSSGDVGILGGRR